MDYIAHYISPIGSITMAACDNALVGLWFDGQKFFANSLSTNHKENPALPVLMQTREWLDIYFSGKAPHFTPPLLMRGTPFRNKVWQQLLRIPYGQTMTYGDVANAIGSQSACAIGGAVAHNSISLLIPCHRVVGKDNTLTGYAGGLDRKRLLLEMENIKYNK